MRQIDPDVVPVYPITPQTPIIQGFAKHVADGRAHGEIVNVESEHSAMSAAIGSALAGARTMTATSSQGLALMAEVVYIAAAMRAPIVMGVGNRALSGPINIHCDHSDSMLVRDSGAIQLFAENAQEAYDLTVLAPRLAEHPDVLLPCSSARTGSRSRTRRSRSRCSTTTTSAASSASTASRTRCSTSRDPTSQGPFAMPDSYFELRYQQVAAMAAALPVFDELATSWSALTGRRYSVRSSRTASTSRARRRLPRLDRRHGEGRRRRSARGRRSGRAAARCARSGRCRAPPSGLRSSERRDGRRARPGRLAGRRIRRWPRRSAPRSPARGALVRSYVYGLGGRELHPEDVQDVFAGRRRRRAATWDCEVRRVASEEPGPQRGRASALRGGHSLCQGCGIPMVVRTILDSIETPVVVVSATGCLEVATTRFPTTAWNVPWLHVAFENAAAVVSGVESAYRALAPTRRAPAGGPVTFVALAGDGGTYDIGLQALSGALERGHRFVFVCYDNEAYMNTGVQRSGATPFGASTTTSPAGRRALGKAQQRKDMTAIAAAHHIPYVAQAASVALARPQRKAERAARRRARRSSTSSPPARSAGATSPASPPTLVNAAVESCYWPLFEVVDGRWRLTYRPERRVPVEDVARAAEALRAPARGPKRRRRSPRSSGASTRTGPTCSRAATHARPARQ